MKFNPKEARHSVHVIDVWDTHNHASPTTMQMCLPNVELATTDAENASVFGPHFDIVFNNHRPIEWTVLYNKKQIYVMEELYPPNSWYKIKKSTTKLENDKEPGLNGVLT